MHPEERGKTSISDFKPLFDSEGGAQIERHILKGMFRHPLAYTTISSNIQGVRAYGKSEVQAIIKYRQISIAKNG